jgi:DNA-binding beta-propeller fold protein YncE
MQTQLKSASLVLMVLVVAIAASRASAATDLLVSDQDHVARFDGTTGALVNANFISLLDCTGVTIGPDGNVYVGTDNPSEIFRYNPTTGAQIGSAFVPFLPPGSTNPDNVIIPEGMHFAANGKLYVADEGGNQNVHIYNADGTSNSTLNGDATLPLLAPTSVAFDSNGNVYVANQNGGNVIKFDTTANTFSQFVPVLDHGLTIPTDLIFGPDHKLYIVDDDSAVAKVLRYNSDGSFDTVFVDYGKTFFTPWGIAFGPDGEAYISGTDAIAGGEVLRYKTNGTFDGIFASGLNNPTFIAFVPEPAGLACVIGIAAALRRRR